MTTDKLIDLIEQIRAENNRRWMDLVRLAFRVAPAEASAIMDDIVAYDDQVRTLSKQLIHANDSDR